MNAEYSAQEIESSREQLAEWEIRLKQAESALANSKSSDYVHLTVVWSNVKGVRDHLRKRVATMLKACEL